jgi:two-component system chemotaxis response regulator CheB
VIRVLVVDDSGFMRIALRRIIEAEGDLRVVGEAANGRRALEEAARLRPDVVAMDVEMPELDGLEATSAIMALPDPPAVVMVSHHTREGSATALAALERGAVDYVWKDSELGGIDLGALDAALRGRLRHWAGARAALRPPAAAPRARAALPVATGPVDIVVLGASTGGPDAVAGFVAAAGRLPVPLVVAQHMPAELGPGFAEHLARRSGVPARVATDGLAPAPGEVTILPGGTDGHLLRRPDGLALRLAAGASLVHPSVDLLFRSAALAARRALGVVLTGMGRDGAEGAAALAQRGMAVLAQSPASSIVAGMPRAVIEAGHAARVDTPAALGKHAAALVEEGR